MKWYKFCLIIKSQTKQSFYYICPNFNMKIFIYFLFFSLSYFSFAQTNDSINKPIDDEINAMPGMVLEEILIIDQKSSKIEEERKKYIILQRRILRVYPFAKITAEKLVALNNELATITSERERKKHIKKVEKYLKEEFEPQLKKLSRKDGQILVKLIHRQTGETTFNLIKEYKSWWKAFWSNNTANLFNISLKTAYDPYHSAEDFLSEGIILTFFKTGQLQKQEPAIPFDYELMKNTWKERLNTSKN